MIRDPIYKALVAQLAALLKKTPYNVQVVADGFVHWDAADQQPAVYLAPGNEGNAYEMNLPDLWLLKPELYIYVKWVDSISQGLTALRAIQDAVEKTLSYPGPNAGPTTAVNTLGGLVAYAAIKGETQISGGFLNQNQTIARMPVEILVPG